MYNLRGLPTRGEIGSTISPSVGCRIMFFLGHFDGDGIEPVRSFHLCFRLLWAMNGWEVSGDRRTRETAVKLVKGVVKGGGGLKGVQGGGLNLMRIGSRPTKLDCFLSRVLGTYVCLFSLSYPVWTFPTLKYQQPGNPARRHLPQTSVGTMYYLSRFMLSMSGNLSQRRPVCMTPFSRIDRTTHGVGGAG